MDLPDAVLVERWRDGDLVAGELLLHRCQAPVFQYLYRLVGDRVQAEELFQDTMSRAVRQLARFDPDRSFLTWLFAIGTNLWRDYIRSRRRTGWREVPGVEKALAAALEPSPLDEALRRELEGEVRQALADLDADHRAVLTLRHYHGCSYAQIAEILSCPVGTVKSRMHAALQALRDRFLRKGFLGEEGKDELPGLP